MPSRKRRRGRMGGRRTRRRFRKRIGRRFRSRRTGRPRGKFGRFRRGNNSRYRISVGKTLPRMADVVLIYNDAQSFNTLPTHEYQYRSTLRDPDFTGTGTQPTYFDQWCGNAASSAFYQEYNTRGMKIKLYCRNTGTVDISGMIVFSDSAAQYTKPTTYLEYMRLGTVPHSKKFYIPKVGTNQNRQKTRGITMYRSTKAVNGIPWNTPNNFSQWNSDPVDEVYITIYLCAFDFTTACLASTYVDITYYASFRNVNQPNAS